MTFPPNIGRLSKATQSTPPSREAWVILVSRRSVTCSEAFTTRAPPRASSSQPPASAKHPSTSPKTSRLSSCPAATCCTCSRSTQTWTPRSSPPSTGQSPQVTPGPPTGTNLMSHNVRMKALAPRRLILSAEAAGGRGPAAGQPAPGPASRADQRFAELRAIEQRKEGLRRAFQVIEHRHVGMQCPVLD
jgi:hypothetical protein